MAGRHKINPDQALSLSLVFQSSMYIPPVCVSLRKGESEREREPVEEAKHTVRILL